MIPMPHEDRGGRSMVSSTVFATGALWREEGKDRRRMGGLVVPNVLEEMATLDASERMDRVGKMSRQHTKNRQDM